MYVTRREMVKAGAGLAAILAAGKAPAAFVHSLMSGRAAMIRNKKKLPYLRSEDGRLSYILYDAYKGVGQYETGWMGSANISGNYQSGAWCGPFGMYLSVYGTQFRWYISKPANEVVSLSSNTQHAFINGINDVPLALLSSVYSVGAVTRGWLVRFDDITVGNNRQAELYCDGKLVSATTGNVPSSFINVKTLPIGIMSGVDPRSMSDLRPGSVSPLKSGSKFYRFYIKKDGELIHDCYPILDGVTPKMYDAVTEQVVEKHLGTVSYGED